MPPTPLHPQLTELLLCGHHYRRHRDALRAQGAAVYDTDGHLTRQW